MKLAGTSDTGWVPMDLTELAQAIAALRASATVARLRAERAGQHRRDSREPRNAQQWPPDRQPQAPR